jgi:hypothetical protein
VRGGKRTGPKNEVLQDIPATRDLSPFVVDLLTEAVRKKSE